MKASYLLLFLACFVLNACNEKSTVDNNTYPTLDTSTTISTIAFGSCNREDLPQPMWEEIVAQSPELWIWLGDNIYGDSDDINVLKAKYEKQDSNAGYQQLRKQVPIIGTWDDHDFGANDAGKEYPHKAASRDLMLEFLDVPKDNPVWNREGGYQSYTIGETGKQVKIILLDARYFRDSLEKNPGGATRYFTNETGDILGEEQWAWFEEELKNSTAQVHLVGSGIQMLPEEQIYEKWDNFPTARKRLLKLLDDTKPSNLLLMSGDRHIGEVTQLQADSLSIDLLEVTSSGLTHSWETVQEVNSKRISPLISEKNYGILQIDWNQLPIKATLELRGLDGKIHHKMEVF